ncbi:MAG TPA: UDP-3-O-(3-hydroxymyristoyl)glucosamine N-acyltransferase [Candidatus Limnocylindria bacterium]|jgi:UDP-3-O-[3-hydroxymyristoyl] glucosamine N-acyltransferase|nr:UDP-3-O-(3-hydroxymyristoyl)glucosamine N-acyltransferase [Candidatus Limnocylindria bacterium]
MKLSEAAAHAALRCVRDADFDDLALLGASDGRVLVYAGDARSLARLAKTAAAAAIVTTAELAGPVPSSLGLAIADRPEATFYDLHRWLHASSDFYWRDVPSVIDPSARVHERAYVAPRNVRIGARVVVEPNATVLERVAIGDDAIVRAGAVLGAEGFEFKGPAMRQGRATRAQWDYGTTNVAVPHAGSVEIGARVEIQANSTVDRSLFRLPTRIGDDTKIDNLVHVAHSVRIGARCLIAAGATIAGNAVIGDEVWIGPHAVISSGVRLGDHAAIVIGSTITKDVAPGERVASDLRVYRLP